VAENHRDLGKPLILNSNPYLAFLKAVRFFAGETERPSPGVHARAEVSKDASVAPDAHIGPMAVIEPGACVAPGAWCSRLLPGGRREAREDVLLYPGVVVREQCVIGDRAIVHPGAVIGSDGFGFVRDGAVYAAAAGR